MPYTLDYISRDDLKTHTKETIMHYLRNSQNYDLKKFNKNIIDPIKLLFDQKVYNVQDEQLVTEEIRRQLDKSNNNAIGYFHQNLFKYIEGCVVPEYGFDIIYNNEIFVELKNKHNTMNSASSQKTYIKFQHQLLENDRATCYLVEIISKESADNNWKIKLDGRNMDHSRIRRCSIDKFLEMITGDHFAFKKLCDILPEIINEVLCEELESQQTQYTVIDELNNFNQPYIDTFMKLAFNSYIGFDDEL